MMINDLIIKRKSIVLFSSDPIPGETIRRLFDAARWAPSSRNVQPWRFIYSLKGDSFYDKMLSCLVEGNQLWAKNAPMLLLTVAQVISDHKDSSNIYAWHDTGMAYSNLVLQATSEGLFVHPMGGFDRRKIREVAGIPEGYDPVVFAAVGYKSDSKNFSSELIKRENSERVRNPIHAMLFHGRFGYSTEFSGE